MSKRVYKRVHKLQPPALCGTATGPIPQFLDAAIREVRMLRNATDHPNIIQLLEAFRYVRQRQVAGASSLSTGQGALPAFPSSRGPPTAPAAALQPLTSYRSSTGRVYMVFEFADKCLSAELHKRFTCGLPAGQTRVVLWQVRGHRDARSGHDDYGQEKCSRGASCRATAMC